MARRKSTAELSRERTARHNRRQREWQKVANTVQRQARDEGLSGAETLKRLDEARAQFKREYKD